MSAPTAHTVMDLVKLAAARMDSAGLAFGHGTECAWDEAAWLVLWRLGLPLDALDDHAQQTVDPQQAQAVDALVTQRIHSRKPAAYLTREAWLQGVPFYVDERSIVPRSFIAEIIADGSIDDWLSERTQRVLDLCCGNGSLAVLAAMAWPDVAVNAADVSSDALAVARINVERHGLQARITLIESDGLKGVPGPHDLILCNPPYVNAQSMAELPAEYQHEPSIALGSGSDGMDFIRSLLTQLREQPEQHLSEDGILVLEIGNERANFERAFPALPVHWLETASSQNALVLITREALRGTFADLGS